MTPDLHPSCGLTPAPDRDPSLSPPCHLFREEPALPTPASPRVRERVGRQLWNTPPPSCPFSPSGLAVGLDPEGYGNPDFCWISIHEPLIWSFAGPVILVLVVSTLRSVPPCAPLGGTGWEVALQQVWWYQPRGARWQSAGFLDSASSSVPDRLAWRWEMWAHRLGCSPYLSIFPSLSASL